MKKILPLLLILLLLFGCGTEVSAPTGPFISETIAPTEPPAPELVLDTWELPYECLDAAPMGDDILLLCGENTTRLVKLRSKNKQELAAADLGCYIQLQSPSVRVAADGICYYDAGCVVFLDADLKEVSRIPLPEDAVDAPAVSADLSTIYYPTAGALRAIDRDTGIGRLLRQVSSQYLCINGLHLNGTVIECLVRDENYHTATQFISAATGELLREYPGGLALWSGSEVWYADTSQDGHTQRLFGTKEKVNALEVEADAIHFLPEMGGILTAVSDGRAATLSIYDLNSGTKTAALTMEGSAALSGVWANAEKNQVWFLLDGKTLCRWTLSKSPVSDAISCIAPYYTRENPDFEGLAALESRAAALGEVYGVRIHIWEDAVAQQPPDYILTSEYRVHALEAGLDGLEAALARLPAGFIRDLCNVSNDGTIHICLVQSLSGPLDTAEGCQFWDDTGAVRLALSARTDVERNFYHELAHVIDIRVLSECNAFDNWNRLNPKGFDYDYDYIANQNRDGAAFAHAFIDTYAMSFPTEDRARIFEYAMLDGNADRFAGDAMQAKLAALCAGIRKACGLKDTEARLPWEQYLS